MPVEKCRALFKYQLVMPPLGQLRSGCFCFLQNFLCQIGIVCFSLHSCHPFPLWRMGAAATATAEVGLAQRYSFLSFVQCNWVSESLKDSVSPVFNFIEFPLSPTMLNPEPWSNWECRLPLVGHLESPSLSFCKSLGPWHWDKCCYGQGSWCAPFASQSQTWPCLWDTWSSCEGLRQWMKVMYFSPVGLFYVNWILRPVGPLERREVKFLFPCSVIERNWLMDTWEILEKSLYLFLWISISQ